MTAITFIDLKNKAWIRPLAPTDDLYDALEELAYIMHEVTPTDRWGWRKELAELSEAQFDYHGNELCYLQRINENTFRMIDNEELQY